MAFSIVVLNLNMQFPTSIFYKRFSRYQADFINLSQIELDFIDSKYLNSKFLRIWSEVGFSCGRFWEIKEVDEYTTDVIEIEDIDSYMKGIHSSWAWVFDSVSKHPNMLKEFQERFKN